MRADSFLRCSLLVGALLAPGFAASGVVPAVTPQPDDVVATQLLPRAQKDSLRRLATAAPADLGQRLVAARRMLETGRASGDPRTLGYAESLLAPWPPDAAATPVDALVLHATIAQSRHAFARARTLLDRVLERSRPGEPAFVQALLTRATVLQVTGELASARADCSRLLSLAQDVALICAASIDMLEGRTESAIALLRTAAARTSGSVRAWALGALAQAHELRGERAAAAGAYQASLVAGDDLATRLAFADLLLADGSAAAAEDLLRAAPPTDGVLLRQWRSTRQLRRPEAAALEERLRARLADARRRGDGSDLLHARDWASFELERGNAHDALRLAEANWRDQREPADLLILARAARAAGDANARTSVRNWIAQTRLQDIRLDALLQEPRS